MIRIFRFPLYTLIFGLTSILIACGGGSQSGDALISIDLIDAPVDSASSVIVRITGLTLKSASEGELTFHYCDVPEPVDTAARARRDEAMRAASRGQGNRPTNSNENGCDSPEVREMDLLTLTNGNTAPLLANESVPPGHYEWIRLWLDDAEPGFIVLENGEQHALNIPSSQNTGLKLVSGFNAVIGRDNRFVIDFDLRKSIHQAGSKYQLRPTLKLVKLEDPEQQVLTGEWLSAEMGECASPMAYVFAGENTTPDDLGSASGGPLTTASMNPVEDGIRYTFQINFIAFGTYTVAYTCMGQLDDPAVDDEIEFPVVRTMTVGG